MANQGFKALTKKEKYVSGRVILQYSNFKEPFAFNDGDIPKYSVTILIPKENKDEIENFKNIIKKHWNEAKIKSGTSPLKDGTTLIKEKMEDEKELDEKYNDFFVFKSTSKFPFKVVTANPKIRFTGEEENIKGYWCRISVDFYAYKLADKKGITSFLKAVQVIEPSGIELPGGDASNDFDEEKIEEVKEDEVPF